MQKLKIDQGFVAGLPGDDDDVAIVRAVIALAQSMGMQVHAEGIEYVEQAQFLLDHHCDLGQGYWFGRPMPARELDWQRAPAIRPERRLSSSRVAALAARVTRLRTTQY